MVIHDIPFSFLILWSFYLSIFDVWWGLLDRLSMSSRIRIWWMLLLWWRITYISWMIELFYLKQAG
jgi:hypothetical protein